MKRILPKTSRALTTTILTTTLVMSQVAVADGVAYEYVPVADISAKFSKARNIGELNYMHPLKKQGNHLPIIDLKLKADNNRSKEINLGLVYRYNYDDKAILGTYAYYDHRVTESNFAVSGATIGAEVLSEYVDVRANYYVSQKRRKKIAHNNRKTVEIKGTSIYAVSGGHKYQSAYDGYDVEAGVPLFSFSEALNDKLGTKVYAGKYNFTAKNVKPIKGTRFRLEQDLGTVWAGNNSVKFHLNAETQFDKVRRRQNFVGIGMKVAFNDKKNKGKKKSSGLSYRMMDTVIRDVDIVTGNRQEDPTISNLFLNGQKKDKLYYVANAQEGYKGDGTKEKPFSIEQLKKMGDISDAMVVLTSIDESKGGKAITEKEYKEITSRSEVLNGKELKLSTVGVAEVVSVTVNGKNGVSIDAVDIENTKIIIQGKEIDPTAKGNTEVAAVKLVEEKIIQNIEQEVRQDIEYRQEQERIAEEEQYARDIQQQEYMQGQAQQGQGQQQNQQQGQGQQQNQQQGQNQDQNDVWDDEVGLDLYRMFYGADDEGQQQGQNQNQGQDQQQGQNQEQQQGQENGDGINDSQQQKEKQISKARKRRQRAKKKQNTNQIPGMPSVEQQDKPESQKIELNQQQKEIEQKVEQEEQKLTKPGNSKSARRRANKLKRKIEANNEKNSKGKEKESPKAAPASPKLSPAAAGAGQLPPPLPPRPAAPAAGAAQGAAAPAQPGNTPPPLPPRDNVAGAVPVAPPLPQLLYKDGKFIGRKQQLGNTPPPVPQRENVPQPELSKTPPVSPLSSLLNSPLSGPSSHSGSFVSDSSRTHDALDLAKPNEVEQGSHKRRKSVSDLASPLPSPVASPESSSTTPPASLPSLRSVPEDVKRDLTEEELNNIQITYKQDGQQKHFTQKERNKFAEDAVRAKKEEKDFKRLRESDAQPKTDTGLFGSLKAAASSLFGFGSSAKEPASSSASNVTPKGAGNQKPAAPPRVSKPKGDAAAGANQGKFAPRTPERKKQSKKKVADGSGNNPRQKNSPAKPGGLAAISLKDEAPNRKGAPAEDIKGAFNEVLTESEKNDLTAVVRGAPRQQQEGNVNKGFQNLANRSRSQEPSSTTPAFVGATPLSPNTPQAAGNLTPSNSSSQGGGEVWDPFGTSGESPKGAPAGSAEKQNRTSPKNKGKESPKMQPKEGLGKAGEFELSAGQGNKSSLTKKQKRELSGSLNDFLSKGLSVK